MENNFKTFPAYVERLQPDLVADRPQLLKVAERMESFLDNGRTGDVLNISMPTRFGKSFLSTAFSAWMILFRDSSTRVLRASYAAELAEAFSWQVRQQVEDFFAPLRMTAATEGTRARWKIKGNTEENHIGTGISGGITGFGCDIAIVDDTAKNMLEATSAAYTRTLSSFKESVLLGRLEGKRKIVNVGTRWTINDWFSMWPDAEEYILPAMTEDGKSVCEAWKTTEELQLERSRVSDEVWNAQYMQRPTATGRIRMFEGWRPVFSDTIPSGRHVLVCDPATDYGSDWFVIGDYILGGGLLYLCDMFASQRATPEDAAAWIKGRDYAVMWVEANGVGGNIITRLRGCGVRSVAGFTTTGDKYSRAYVRMNDVRNYLRVCPTMDGITLEELQRQADGFPVADHDDLIDNVVMAFERLLNH